MATEIALHTLLSSVPRLPQAVVACWLTKAERGERGDARIRCYLARTRDAAARARAMDGLGAAARALFARIARGEEHETVGEVMARTAADGFAVSPDVFAELHRCGLAFIDDPALWPGTKATWTPEHFRRGLATIPGFDPATLPIARGTIALPASVPCTANPSTGAAAPLAALLGEFVNAAARGSLRVTQSGEFASRVRAAFDRMSAREEVIGDSWPRHLLVFARAASLVRVDGAGYVVPTRRLALFRQKSSADQIKILLDYSADHLVEPESIRERCGFAPRRFVLDVLRTACAGADDDAWLPVASLAVMVARQASPLASARKASGPCSWHASTCTALPRRAWEGVVAELLDGFLVPAGALERAADDRGNPCVRVTPFGRFWFTGDPAALQGGRRSRLVVQTDFTALLTHSGPWDRVAQVLSFFASRSGDNNASIFKFDRDHVHAAIRHGHRVEELVEALDAHSAYPVPDNVRAMLHDWAAVSSPAVLYRDVNMFSFSTSAERETFLTTLGDQRAVRIGTQHVLSLLPEQRLMDFMQRVRAAPVDYTQPPVAGIEILSDGRVTSQAINDLRVCALIETVAVPMPGMPGWFRLSAARAASVTDPEDVYDQIVRLPGKPLLLPVRVALLVALGLLDALHEGGVAVVEGLAEAEKKRLKPCIRWRSVLAAQAGKDLWVLKPGCADVVRATLATARSTATVTMLALRDMPQIAHAPLSEQPLRHLGLPPHH